MKKVPKIKCCIHQAFNKFVLFLFLRMLKSTIYGDN